MSVFVFVRIKTEPGTLERVAAERADEMRAVSQEGRDRGAVHHCFIEVDGDVMVVDEWDSAESFQEFFSSNEVIPRIMEATGVQAEPEISIHRKLDTPDAF